jgi:hypothetical protein
VSRQQPLLQYVEKCSPHIKSRLMFLKSTSLQIGTEGTQNKYAYDYFEPSWNCDLKRRVPLTSGDGPKWMCGAELLTADSLVYSFGSAGRNDFEIALMDKYTKQIFIFDPTVRKEDVKRIRSEGFTFLELALLGRGQSSVNIANKTYPGMDIVSHMKALGHTGRVIDVLKIDVEGSEYMSLRDFVVGDCTGAQVRADQILIELHNTNVEKIAALMDRLMKCNMRIFSKERNHWGCDGYKCVEFSFVGPTQAFKVFKATHPSCSNSSA